MDVNNEVSVIKLILNSCKSYVNGKVGICLILLTSLHYIQYMSQLTTFCCQFDILPLHYFVNASLFWFYTLVFTYEEEQCTLLLKYLLPENKFYYDIQNYASFILNNATVTLKLFILGCNEYLQESWQHKFNIIFLQ